MKRKVWANKSNGQLCVTVPQNSGFKEGDIVNIEKYKIRTIIYSVVAADLFHYGHLRLLQSANEKGDVHVCGVLTNKAIRAYKNNPVANFKERKAIISSLRCVDMVMTQEDIDPTENLKKLKSQFKGAKIILVFGSNWKKVPGSSFIKKIGGEIFQPPYYERLSQEEVMKKITR